MQKSEVGTAFAALRPRSRFAAQPSAAMSANAEAAKLALPAADPSSYEDVAVPWASELSDLLVGRMSDGWAARCSSLTELYEAQQTESWCGYASLRLALRALAPAATIPTQTELASKYQFRGGISLAELRATAEAEARIDPGIRTTQVDGHLATLPHALLDDLRRDADDSIILVNVLRYVADRWTGHWQPVGGYSELSDDEAFVLLLDPARHKCVWHWVPLRLVVGCVCTTNSRGEARGYLRLARG